MKKAILVERKARYADFQGKHHTFSGFMRKPASELSRAYPHEPVWVTIRGLFRSYSTTDVASRISILLRVDQLLSELQDKRALANNSTVAQQEIAIESTSPASKSANSSYIKG